MIILLTISNCSYVFHGKNGKRLIPANGSRTSRLQALTVRGRGLRAAGDVLRVTDTHLVKAVRINAVIDLHVRSLSEAPVYSSFYTLRSIKSCRGEGGSRAGGAFVSRSDSLGEWVSALHRPLRIRAASFACPSSLIMGEGLAFKDSIMYLMYLACS